MQRQTPIPPGNQQHCYVHTATGELNTTASPKQSPGRQHHASLGYASLGNGSPGLLPGALPNSGGNPANLTPGCASQALAPSQWLTSAGEAAGNAKRAIDVSECRAVLGEPSFTLLRGAMLAQQDLFLEQLWELHRLARVQGRKALQPDIDVTADSMTAESRNIGCGIFNREHQAALRAETMHTICALPTIPEPLKRNRQARMAAMTPTPCAAPEMPSIGFGPLGTAGGNLGGVAAGGDMATLSALPGNGTRQPGLSGLAPLLSQSPQNAQLPQLSGAHVFLSIIYTECSATLLRVALETCVGIVQALARAPCKGSATFTICNPP